MATRSLADLVAEQNRLAIAKAPQHPYVVVRVLVANRYNGPDLKASRANTGDVIAVAGGRYVADLIAGGFVEIPQIPVEELSADESGDNEQLFDLTIAELRSLAKTAGINSRGLSKAALIEALADESLATESEEVLEGEELEEEEPVAP